MMLSTNFSLEEMTFSQEAVLRNIENKPNEIQIIELQALCAYVLQPLRDQIGKPITVTSGFRSPALNKALGAAGYGVAENSQHMKGQAADIRVVGMPSIEVFQIIQRLNLPVDQVIDEFGIWVHVSHRSDGKQRGEVLRNAYNKFGRPFMTRLAIKEKHEHTS